MLLYMLNLWVGHLGFLGGPNRWAMAKQYQNKLKTFTANAALVSSAMEFQEAQAFFTMAIQVATVATFHSSCGAPCTEINSISSISESIINLGLVRVLAVNNILFVLLIQSVLQGIGMKWYAFQTLRVSSLDPILLTWKWRRIYRSYNLVLVFGTLILASVVDKQRMTLSRYEELLKQVGSDETIPECGGNPPLTEFCLTAIYRFGFQPLPVLIIAYPTVAVLILDQALSAPVFSRDLSSVVLKFPLVTNRLLTLTKVLFRLFWVGIEAILILYTAVHINTLKDLAERLVTSSTLQWSYGQVISAMIWVPILGKLVYYNICKYINTWP